MSDELTPKQFARRRAHFWTVLVNALSALGAIFAAVQIYQAAELQKKSIEIELALSVHSAAFDFLAAVSQYKFEDASRLKRISPVDVEGLDHTAYQGLPEAIRSSVLKLDGAIGRAAVIRDDVLKTCIFEMRDKASAIVNLSIPLQKDIDVSGMASALNQFSSLVGAYAQGSSYPRELLPTKDDAGLTQCGFIRQVDVGVSVYG